jgi:AcrR family transcriptional regulator
MASAARTERTRGRLVRATRDELAGSGSFTAERVVARAGLSPATFYVYFPTKDDALVAAFASVLDDLVGFVDAAFTIERLLDEGLDALCASVVREGAAFFARQALVFRTALARLSESRALRTTWREHERAVFARYRRFLELGQQAGRIRAGELDPLAQALLVLTQGLNNPLLLGRRPRDPVFTELGRSLAALLAPEADAR